MSNPSHEIQAQNEEPEQTMYASSSACSAREVSSKEFSHHLMDERPAFFCAQCGNRGHHAEQCRKFQFKKPLNRSNPTHGVQAQNKEPERTMYASSIAYSARGVSFGSRSRQRHNRNILKSMKNVNVVIPNEFNSFGRKVTLNNDHKKLKSVIVDVARETSPATSKGLELKITDNDESDSEVQYRIGDVSPSSLSIDDISDVETKPMSPYRK